MGECEPVRVMTANHDLVVDLIVLEGKRNLPSPSGTTKQKIPSCSFVLSLSFSLSLSLSLSLDIYK